MEVTDEEIKGFALALIGLIPYIATAIYIMFEARKDARMLDEYNKSQKLKSSN